MISRTRFVGRIDKYMITLAELLSIALNSLI